MCVYNLVVKFHCLPTTSRSRNILVGGWVDTWHSYSPASLGWTYFIWSVQSSLWWKWIAWNRSSLAYVVSPTVSSSCNSRFFRLIHDTCEQPRRFNNKWSNLRIPTDHIIRESERKTLIMDFTLCFLPPIRQTSYSDISFRSVVLHISDILIQPDIYTEF